jgi:hypothetical protein
MGIQCPSKILFFVRVPPNTQRKNLEGFYGKEEPCWKGHQLGSSPFLSIYKGINYDQPFPFFQYGFFKIMIFFFIW